jgi:hypothetical protein
MNWEKVAKHLEFVAEARMTYSVEDVPSDKRVAQNNLVADIVSTLANAIRAGLVK